MTASGHGARDLLALAALVLFMIGGVLVEVVVLGFLPFWWWGPPCLAAAAAGGFALSLLAGGDDAE